MSGQRKKKPIGRYFIFTTEDLATLFNVHRETINNWIRKRRLDPDSLDSIIKLYIELNTQ